MARVFALELLRERLVDHEAVVVEQFLFRADVAQRVNKHAALDLLGLAVRRARMVDPARAVAVDLAVDHVAAIEREIERVIRFVRIVRVTTQRFFPRDPLTLVFDQSFAGSDCFHGKHALAVHTRTTHSDPA